MSSDLREKLKSELMTGLWSDLKEHMTRNAVFVVSQDLDLLSVAVSIATDDVAVVTKWIEEQSLSRPTEAQLSTWEKEPAKSFRFVILQPHVLIQEQGH